MTLHAPECGWNSKIKVSVKIMKKEVEQSFERAKEFLGKTKNGFDVYVDMESSHAATHFAHQPELFGAVREVISSIDAEGNVVRVETDLGRVIGETDLVETTEQDEIVYARRPLRGVQYSRFVKNKSSSPTSWVTVDLRKDGENYRIYTAFVGRLAPSFPGGDFLAEKSREFWSTHALVWGSQEVVLGTETTECPW